MYYKFIFSIKKNIIVKNSDPPYNCNWIYINNINWSTHIKNQRRCPSCVLFSIINALESIINHKIFLESIVIKRSYNINMIKK